MSDPDSRLATEPVDMQAYAASQNTPGRSRCTKRSTSLEATWHQMWCESEAARDIGGATSAFGS